MLSLEIQLMDYWNDIAISNFTMMAEFAIMRDLYSNSEL